MVLADSFLYNKEGQTIKRIDRLKEHSFTYNEKGQVVHEKSCYLNRKRCKESVFAYDSLGRVISTIKEDVIKEKKDTLGNSYGKPIAGGRFLVSRKGEMDCYEVYGLNPGDGQIRRVIQLCKDVDHHITLSLNEDNKTATLAWDGEWSKGNLVFDQYQNIISETEYNRGHDEATGISYDKFTKTCQYDLCGNRIYTQHFADDKLLRTIQETATYHPDRT